MNFHISSVLSQICICSYVYICFKLVHRVGDLLVSLLLLYHFCFWFLGSMYNLCIASICAPYRLLFFIYARFYHKSVYVHMYIHFKLVHRVGDSFVSLLLCGSCIIRVTTHGHQCVSWTREKLRAGMYLRMQVRIQPHPVGSPLGVGDFSRISHGLSRTIGCKVQEIIYSFL